MERENAEKRLTIARWLSSVSWRRLNEHGAPNLLHSARDGVDDLPYSYLRRYGVKSIVGRDVTLVVGCAQDFFQHHLIECAVAILKNFGIRVAVAKGQPCCGALFEPLTHDSSYPDLQQKAQQRQQQLQETFKEWLPKNGCFLADGCCQFSAGEEAKNRSISAFILSLIQLHDVTLSFPEEKKVYFQPFCRQVSAAKELVRCIQGINIQTLKQCCGGECGDGILSTPELHESIDQQLPTGATVVVSTPECYFQFARSRVDLNIVHPVELVADAMGLIL